MEIYNIGKEDELTISEIVKKIAAEFDVKVKIVPGKKQPGGTARRVPDISKIKKLGFKPKYSFDKGLHETFIWYNQNIHKKPSALNI